MFAKIEASQNIQVCFLGRQWFGVPQVWAKIPRINQAYIIVLIILSLCCGEEDLSRIEIDSAALSVWIHANPMWVVSLNYPPLKWTSVFQGPKNSSWLWFGLWPLIRKNGRFQGSPKSCPCWVPTATRPEPRSHAWTPRTNPETSAMIPFSKQSSWPILAGKSPMKGFTGKILYKCRLSLSTFDYWRIN